MPTSTVPTPAGASGAASKLKIGIIREGKVPPDKRVTLTPKKCAEVLEQYSRQVDLVVQPSQIRCFRDEEYAAMNVPLQEDLSDRDVLLGVKEVPLEQLLEGKTYFFFSHTVKKQPYNRKLLQTILQKNITLVDYEVLTNERGERIIAFGRWAGIVGAYNGLLTYCRRHHFCDLKPAHQCVDMEDMQEEFYKVKQLPPIKIAVTGGGRVAMGAAEVLDRMGIKKVTPHEYLVHTFEEPVYTQLHSSDYHLRKDHGPWNSQHFYQHPDAYESTFGQFTKVTDLLIAAAYWHPAAPVLFTADEMKAADFRINTIADITCDIEGSIPSTKRASTIAEPAYDYNPATGTLEPAYNSERNITVMAIDNLPCELPRNASRDFGRQFIDNVLPHLVNGDPEGVIARATITRNGQLTEPFRYLQDYVAQPA